MRIFSVALAFSVLMFQSVVMADGASTYAEYCQGCHGGDAAGLAEFSGSQADFQKILEGETALQMPDFFDVFRASEIDALFEYIKASAQQSE